MLAKRIIPCLDVKDKKVVKGIGFNNLMHAGDPVELARKYYEDGADELVFLDISASVEKRDILIDIVKKTASQVFIPFTVGGGIKNIQDISKLLASGADKVALNTNAFLNPSLISEASEEFGAQCIVLAVDAKKNTQYPEVFIYGGRKGTGTSAIDWIKKAVELGAGEILLTSIDRDGTKSGFDCELTSLVSRSINVPVIASGGAKCPLDFLHAFNAGADAALAASIFHYKNYTVAEIKRYLKEKGVVIR